MVDNKREYIFDTIKVIAILMVVITHFPWTDAERLRYGLPFWIDTAMPIFMMLSGYFCFRSFYTKKLETFSDVYEISYLFKRLMRFALPFILIIPIDIICGMCGPNHATFTSCLSRIVVGGQRPGSYYVPMMIQFVMLFPVIYIGIRKWRFYGVVFFIALNFTYECCCSAFDIHREIYSICVLRHFGVIALGAFASYLSISKIASASSKVMIMCGAFMSLCVVLYLYFSCYGHYSPIIFSRWETNCLMASLYTVGFFYLFIGAGGVNRLHGGTDCKKMLAGIGSKTYEIYLMQKLFYAFPAVFVLKLPIYWLIKLMICVFCCFTLGMGYGRILTWLKFVMNKYVNVKLTINADDNFRNLKGV